MQPQIIYAGFVLLVILFALTVQFALKCYNESLQYKHELELSEGLIHQQQVCIQYQQNALTDYEIANRQQQGYISLLEEHLQVNEFPVNEPTEKVKPPSRYQLEYVPSFAN